MAAAKQDELDVTPTIEHHADGSTTITQRVPVGSMIGLNGVPCFYQTRPAVKDISNYPHEKKKQTKGMAGK